MMSRPISAGLLVTCLAVPAAAQHPAFASILPSNSLALVVAPDIGSTIREFQKHPLARMWREDEVQNFVANGMKMATQSWEQMLAGLRTQHKEGRFPFDPDSLQELRVNSVGLALTSLGLNVVDGEAKPTIGLMMMADFGATADKWRKVIDFGVAQIGKAPGATRSERVVSGLQVFSLQFEDAPVSLNWTFDGSRLLFATIPTELDGAIARIKAQKDSGLLGDLVYVACAKHLESHGAELELFVQPALLVDRFVAMMREATKLGQLHADIDGIDRALTVFGCRSIKSVGATVRYEDNKTVTRLFAHSPEPERNGIFAQAQPPLNLDFLRWIPKESANFVAASLSPLVLYDSAVAAAKAYNKEQAEMALAQLAKAEEQIGVSLREDLFGSIGKRMVWWSMGMAGLNIPEWGILLEAKDEKKLMQCFEALCKLSRGVVELVPTEKRGIKSWTIRFDAEAGAPPPGLGRFVSMAKPTFTFHQGHLVAALAEADVRRACKRMKNETANSDEDVRSNKGFAVYQDVIPKTPLTSLAWADWKLDFERLYQFVAGFAPLMPQSEDFPFDVQLLPEVETLSKHLFASVGWTETRGDGYSMTSISPLGPELLVAAAIGTVTIAGTLGFRQAAPAMRAVPVRAAQAEAKADPDSLQPTTRKTDAEQKDK